MGVRSSADACADRWARSRHIDVQAFPAAWVRHGNAAGPIRNGQMLRDGKPGLVVAFPGGRGTRNHRGRPNICQEVRLHRW
ncbi:hypothetical protein [Bradyrhizobium liaoningense]|uniref:hypothetical protein n=1 Tax=Bradyrhizobium liaoningense TaxID=43992 RepID=UPI001BA6DB05|nr:hypothetical protein [Bradyrhizobium liaoningense]MBR0908260.1 hypothetical protein [Bradyrhizobium liaoningense]